MGEASSITESTKEDTANILLTTDSSGQPVRTCADLFQPEAGAVRGLVVTAEQSVDDWLSTHGEIERMVEELIVVSVGEGVRSTAATQTRSTPAPTPDHMLGEPVLEFIPDPGNFTELGMKLNAHLTESQDHATTDHTKTVLCLDSISTLVDASDVQTVFRFLHILTTLVRAQDATAHYHLNPAELDPETVSTLSVLFDAALES